MLCTEVGTDDLEAAAAEYSRRWLPSAHAVVTLTAEAFGGNARAFAPNLKLVQARLLGLPVLGECGWNAASGGPSGV